MRKLFFTTLVFAIMTTCVFGQITTGQMTIQNMGSHYEIKKDNVVPFNGIYPIPDSSSLVVNILSSNPMQWQSNSIKTFDVLKYKLKGNIIISSSIIWWRQGKKSQTNMKTICINGNSNLPTNGFLKI